MQELRAQFLSILVIAAAVLLVENQSVPNAVAILFYGGIYFLFSYVTGRPKFSLFVALIVMGGIYFSSSVKFQLMDRNLHALDFYLYFNWSMFRYFSELYPSYAQWALILPATILLLSYLFWRREPARRSQVDLAVAVFAFSTLWFLNGFVFSKLHNQGRPSSLWMRDRFHLSSTVFSILDLTSALRRGQLFEFGPVDARISALWPDGTDIAACPIETSDAALPNVVFALRESAMIPSILDGRLGKSLGPAKFASSNGRTLKLTVETHGGGTAWTIFSLFSGLSTRPFGELRYLVNDFTPSRIDVSLAKALSKCGYQTLAITTGAESFATSRAYFEGLGFQHYVGIEALKERGDISDRGVYALLHEKMAELAARSPKPILAFVDTTVTHAPYDYELRPDEVVNEASQIENPVVREYARRVEIGERDLDQFIQRISLSSLAPTVIVDFGDHQPYFTKNMTAFGSKDEFALESITETFFRIRAGGSVAQDLSKVPDHVDIMFLGDALMEALNWKVSGYYSFRRNFMRECQGDYWECQNGAHAHTLHRRLQSHGALRF